MQVHDLLLFFRQVPYIARDGTHPPTYLVNLLRVLILIKETEIRDTQERLTALSELIKDSDLVCPE